MATSDLTTTWLARAVAAQHLDDRSPARQLLEAPADLLGVGVQDTPPGSLAAALAARVDGLDVAALDEALTVHRTVVVAYTVRGAPHAVPAAELAWWAAAVRPADAAAAGARLFDFGRTLLDAGQDPLEGLDAVAAAVAEALSDGPLDKPGLSTVVRKRVAAPWRPWCAGCGVDHVQDTLFRWAVLQAGAVLVPGARPQAYALARDWLGGAQPGSPRGRRPPAGRGLRQQLVERFVAAAGVATPATFAAWLEASRAEVDPWWSAAEPQLHRRSVGRRTVWTATDGDPPQRRPTRLLPANDPLLRLGDRELLLPDPEHRRAVYRPVNGPGVVLLRGRPAGTWRARAGTSGLDVTATPFDPDRRWSATDRAALDREAQRLAAARGQARGALAPG